MFYITTIKINIENKYENKLEMNNLKQSTCGVWYWEVYTYQFYSFYTGYYN